jgi:uridine kinase
MNSTLIAIAGFSNSGKTTIARRLAAHFNATIFGLDDYYLDYPHLTYEQRCEINFDHPDSLDGAMIIQHLRDLKVGKPIVRPVYDFSTHSRTPHTQTMHPNNYIIVEGLFTLYWDEARPLYSAKIFVDADHDICLARREARDVAERGRTLESIRKQYAETVRPMADQFIAPARAHADLFLRCTDPPEQSLRTVLDFLERSPR